MILCQHCHRNKATRPRGLCFGCYLDVAIRSLYPSKTPNRGEPTEAELEAMVAERSKPENLPIWWFNCVVDD